MKDSKGRKLRENESQRKDGMYRYRYSVDGKRCEVCSWRLLPSDRMPPGKKEKPSLREMEEQIQRDLLNGLDVKSAKVTVAEYAWKFVDMKRNINQSTAKVYRSLIKAGIETAPLGKMYLEEVKYSNVLRFLSDLLKKGYKFSYVKRYYVFLFSLFKWAIEEHLVLSNPCFQVMQQLNSKKVVSERKALTREQQSKLMSFVKDESPEMYVLLSVALGAGLRLGELIGLTWDEINLEQGYIYLEHQLVYEYGSSIKFRIAPPKYGEIRKIPLQKNLIRILTEYKEGAVNAEVNVDGISGFLFYFSTHPLLPFTVSYRLHQLVKKYNALETQNAEREGRIPVLVESCTPHVLRHTFCTRLAESGINIKVLQTIMGHSDASITLEIYNHVTFDRIMSQLPKIEQLEL